MIIKASLLTRTERNKMQTSIRGIYHSDDEEIFDVILSRFPSGVVTLKTALSFYDLIDTWIQPPYDIVFQTGYRKINDSRISQYRDNKDLLMLGTIRQQHNQTSFLIYDKERLLIELFRKEKHIPKDIYKEAIFSYRKLASSGELNIPLIREYISNMPKSNIYKKRLSTEVL